MKNLSEQLYDRVDAGDDLSYVVDYLLRVGVAVVVRDQVKMRYLYAEDITPAIK